MINVTIIYLEDSEDGNVQVSVEAIGEPDQSLSLCNEVMREVLKKPKAKLLYNSIFTRPHKRVQ